MEAKLENTCNKHKKDLSFFQSHNDCPTCHQSIDEAFKANRDMNVKLHGMDFSKWTNFMWSGKKTGNKLEEFHPYQQDDIDKRGAKVGNSVPFETEIFKTTDEIQSLVDSKKVDSKSKDTITGLLDTVV